MQALGDQRMGQREQHRGVGVRPDRNPFRANGVRAVLADRADVDDLDAGLRQLRNPPPVECEAQPPLVTWVFFGLAPPNSTISLACRAIDDQEVSGPVTDCGAADDVRQKRQRRAEAVVGHLIDKAAGRRQEPVQLRRAPRGKFRPTTSPASRP